MRSTLTKGLPVELMTRTKQILKMTTLALMKMLIIWPENLT